MYSKNYTYTPNTKSATSTKSSCLFRSSLKKKKQLFHTPLQFKFKNKLEKEKNNKKNNDKMKTIIYQ